VRQLDGFGRAISGVSEQSERAAAKSSALIRCRHFSLPPDWARVASAVAPDRVIVGRPRSKPRRIALSNVAKLPGCRSTGIFRRVTSDDILCAEPKQFQAFPRHPFGTIKARMGATHFLTKTLPRVGAEMALHVLAYSLTRVMNIIGIQPLVAAMKA
jgi:hypothetical protein